MTRFRGGDDKGQQRHKRDRDDDPKDAQPFDPRILVPSLFPLVLVVCFRSTEGSVPVVGSHWRCPISSPAQNRDHLSVHVGTVLVGCFN